MAAAKISDDFDYEIWAPATKTTLIEQGLWDVVENGVPPDPSKIPELAVKIQAEELSKWRDLVVKDAQALQVLQSSLPKSTFRKTLSASSAKYVWDLLKNGKEGEKLRRLEKQFEELSMEEGEPLTVYIDRVTGILEQLRRLNREKSIYEVNKKVLSSLSMPFKTVAPILTEHMELMEKMPLESLVEFFDIYDSVAEEFALLMLKGMCLDSKPEKWCGVCNKSNHNEEECYFIHRAGSSSGARRGKPRKGECFQCGERGHYARECKRKNQQQQVATEAQEEEEVEIDYLMLEEEALGKSTYDEDVWMVYRYSTDHMTPYVKYFTALDRTHKANVGLADGNYLRVEGRGDLKIMTEGKKKTIKNVLYVPGLNRNVLSLDQMSARGYSAIMKPDKCIFHDRTGAVFGDSVWDERGPALRLQVIEGNMTS